MECETTETTYHQRTMPANEPSLLSPLAMSLLKSVSKKPPEVVETPGKKSLLPLNTLDNKHEKENHSPGPSFPKSALKVLATNRLGGKTLFHTERKKSKGSKLTLDASSAAQEIRILQSQKDFAESLLYQKGIQVKDLRSDIDRIEAEKDNLAVQLEVSNRQISSFTKRLEDQEIHLARLELLVQENCHKESVDRLEKEFASLRFFAGESRELIEANPAKLKSHQPEPIAIDGIKYPKRHVKAYYERGVEVSAGWCDPKACDMEDIEVMWCKGVIEDFEDVPNGGQYGPTRYYTVKFDDIRKGKQKVIDAYVMSSRDYDLTMSKKRKGVRIRRDNKSCDSWAKLMGWYVVKIHSNNIEFPGLYEAMLARDRSIYVANETRPEELNFPEEFDDLVDKEELAIDGVEDDIVDEDEVVEASRLNVGMYVRISGTGQHNDVAIIKDIKQHEVKVKWTTSGQQCWYSISLIKPVIDEDGTLTKSSKRTRRRPNY